MKSDPLRSAQSGRLCFRDFMLGFTFPVWTLTVCLSEGVQTSSEGRPQVVGSLQPIVATLGDDVILLCHVEPPLSVENMTVTWWKYDPGDPESEYKYVHRYHNNQDVEDMKLSAYVGRTTLFTDGLKHGNVSLKITNLKLSDQGIYRCLILQLWSSAVIKLNVVFSEPNSVQMTTETPLDDRDLQLADPNNETNVRAGRSHLGALIVVVVWVLLVLGGGVGGYLLKHKKQQELLKYDDAPNKPLPV
ncbi:selection and upkeep of intraepithelial T-cells protein 4-like isoform X1 [Dicentrarchus labrax]|uniref:selection and upkeep of intraepithelial T-cells protein 4-like isoform X1 n=1 Tax=Dicentrarchus labrax TaxID=13489 RepID=UPI0021F63B9D|nr:selection and upkeep of intraepithelial T-cells protein 4-like isoform X1 [Dicentrarchus labrax]XP_051282820.1 selection and upkeep of intraepithelial T-cells protein 4-like isoform X1 [Dicentrarchus labrax]